MPSVRELINSCIARIYVDNDDNGIIIWQIHNRQIDEDSINAILSENKKSIYTEPCIDANELGSPSSRLKERLVWGVVNDKLCIMFRRIN